MLVFATLHYLLVLVAAGDLAEADDLVRSLEFRAATGMDDQALVASIVGLPLARVILDLARDGPKRTAPELAALVHGLPQIGGSWAHRDVFIRSLAELVARKGDLATLCAILALRRQMKCQDRFTRLLGLEEHRTITSALAGGSRVGEGARPVVATLTIPPHPR